MRTINQHSNVWTLAVFATTVLFGFARADADEDIIKAYGSERLISLATGYQQPISQAPAVASVITAQDIKNSGARNLTDILNQVPGFHVGVSFIAWDPIFAVRGFSSSFNQNVLLMLDGIPQTELFLGDRRITLGKIPLDIIDRVEIVRGPGSALYGADAFTGVVNIITRKQAPTDTQVTVSRGSFDTSNARFVSGTKIKGVNIVTALEYTQTDRHAPRIEQDQQTLLDLSFGTNASLAPSNAKTDREELGFHLNAAGKYANFAIRASRWNDIGLGVGVAGALDPVGRIDSDVVEATYGYQRDVIDDFALGATLDYTLVDYALDTINFLPPGAFGVFPQGVILDENHEETFWKFRLDGRYSGFTSHVLSVGAGVELGDYQQSSERRNYITDNGLILPIGPLQDTSNDPILGQQTISRDLRFIYFQDEWSLYPDWTLTWGLRYDDYSDFGSTTNPRAVLVWNARQNLTTKLLYGGSFRAPSLVETTSQHLPAIRSNPDLKPETLNTVELAMDYRPTPRIRTGANIFYHKTDDQIRQQNTGGPDFMPENVGDQTGRGLELELWWELARNLNLYSFYAYQDNTDETTNEDAGYTPHHKVYARLQKKYRDWFFNVAGTYIGDRDRIAEDTRPEADTYTFIDFLARYKLSTNFEASLDIRNIFDEEAEEAGFGTSFPGDMPLPGRNYYASLTVNF